MTIHCNFYRHSVWDCPDGRQTGLFTNLSMPPRNQTTFINSSVLNPGLRRTGTYTENPVGFNGQTHHKKTHHKLNQILVSCSTNNETLDWC